MKKHCLLLGQIALLTFATGLAQAAEIKATRTVRNVDMATAGIGGIDTGTGSLALSGVSGGVQKAYLYWHGINNNGGAYNKPTITFAGQSVTGASLGISGTNCWGNGQSQAFEADVTSLVAGNGSYSLSGLAGGTGEHPNGASLVVLYNDGNAANNRDFVFFTGNDSSSSATTFGDPDLWHASLPGIDYTGGSVYATVHVADGQDDLTDAPLRFSTSGGSVTIADNATLYDSVSVPSGGLYRTSNTADSLYDIHTFDITAAFGAGTGTRTLAVDSTERGNDCLALINMTLSFKPGDAPDVGDEEPTPTCAEEGYTGTKLIWCKNICENGLTGATLDIWIHRWINRYRKLPACAAEGGGEEEPPLGD
jgi:hypothetical protein